MYNAKMTPKLTQEMREALQDDSRHPVQVEDEVTHDRYVLLPLSVYQRVRSIVDDGLTVDELQTLQDEALAAVWDDPELDLYNDYDAHRSQT